MRLRHFAAPLLCALYALLVSAIAQAQTPELDFTLKTILPQQVRDWNNSNNNAVLTVNNPASDIFTAKIDVQIRVGDTLFARARLFNQPLLQVHPGVNTYTAEQIFSTVELEWYRREEAPPTDNSVLPSGAYTLCLQLIEEDGAQPLSLPICRPFMIRGAVRPSLLYPARAVTISAEQEEMSFRWALPAGTTAPSVQWIVRVVEANAGGSDSLALVNGAVVLERIVRDSTALALTAPSSYFKVGNRYVWSVRAQETALNTAPAVPAGMSTAWAVPVAFTVLNNDKRR